MKQSTLQLQFAIFNLPLNSLTFVTAFRNLYFCLFFAISPNHAPLDKAEC